MSDTAVSALKVLSGEEAAQDAKILGQRTSGQVFKFAIDSDATGCVIEETNLRGDISRGIYRLVEGMQTAMPYPLLPGK